MTRRSRTTKAVEADTEKTPVVVLLSGGIDSAATLAFCMHEGLPVVGCIFFDYGQPARTSEALAAEGIAKWAGFHLDTYVLPGVRPDANRTFFGRNALFVLTGAALVPNRPVLVAAGIHSGTPHYDTTTAFVADCQRLLDGYSDGTVRLFAPFVAATKQQVLEYARAAKIPLEATYSCETRSAPPCGACASCLDRRLLDA